MKSAETLFSSRDDLLEIQHSIGAKARIKRCPPFALGAELASGTEVTVIATAPGTTTVQDENGREWQVSQCCVSAGMLYQIGNEKRWRPADDPTVKAELQRILAAERDRLATCDASTAVVVEKACEGLEAQLAAAH